MYAYYVNTVNHFNLHLMYQGFGWMEEFMEAAQRGERIR